MIRLEHRRSTAREGVRLLVGLGASVVGLGVLQVFLFPSIWEESPRFVVAFFAIEALVTVVVLTFALLNVMQGEEFVCRIDESCIQCFCPVSVCGQTFKIHIADVVKVEREEWSDSHRWYLWDKAGRKYWLTSNYGNPADQIIELVREANAAVAEVRT